MKQSKFICSMCDEGYLYFRDFRNHVCAMHSGHPGEVARHPRKKITCPLCQKQFNTTRFFENHKLKVHNLETIKWTTYNCPLCSYKHYKRNKVLEHFNADHNIQLEMEHCTFPSENEFQKWKETAEKETDSKYVQQSTEQALEYSIYFDCHRSGSGNGLCPSRMHVIIDNKETFRVTFIKTHIGHTDLDSTNSESFREQVEKIKNQYLELLSNLYNPHQLRLARNNLQTLKATIEVAHNVENETLEMTDRVSPNSSETSRELFLVKKNTTFKSYFQNQYSCINKCQHT